MFRRPPESEKRNGDEENPFLLSFSDLMASLLAIFILALVVMMIQLHLKQKELEEDRQKVRLSLIELRESLAEIQETQQAVASALEGVGLREKSLEGMLEEIQKDLKEQGIEVLVTENGTVLRIPEKALSFGLNRFEVQERYRPAADLIGAALVKALKAEANRRILDTVFIEGHTDAVPNRREMGNWGLSTYRAISLWLYWTEEPGSYAELKALKSLAQDNGNGERPLISTSGYAETRPTGMPRPEELADDDPGNPADRRIDIRFTLASQEKKDLTGLKEKLQRMRSKTDELIDKLEGLE
ncbi:OmpA family protein [Akkermansiaceae bacterium]|nr:OmpA family protein [Akkermansiaceae bacterium]